MNVVKLSAVHSVHGIVDLRVPEADVPKVIASLKSAGFSVNEPAVAVPSQASSEAISRTDHRNPVPAIPNIIDGKTIAANEPTS